MSFAQFLSILRWRYKEALVVFLPIVIIVTLGSILWTPSYTATATVVVDTVKPDPLSSASMMGGMYSASFIATQIDVLQSDRVAQRVVRNLKLVENAQLRSQWQEATGGSGEPFEQWLGTALRKNLEVRPSRESTVITVSFKSPDPKFAAGLANAFVQAYLDTNLELRVDPARVYSSFFDQRAKEARDVLEKAQSRLSEFQKENGIVATDERLDVENARLADLSAQVVGLQSLAADSGSRQSASRQGSDRMAEVLANPLVSGLKTDQARLEAKLQELMSRLGDNNPQVLEVRANLAETRLKVDAETARVLASLGVTNTINEKRYAEVKAAFEAQRAKILRMKAVRDDGAVLVRDVETAQRTYDQVTQRRNQASLESLANQSNVSVLSQASAPSKPSSPLIVLNIVVAVFFGLVLAAGAVIAREMADRRVRSAEDLIQALGAPVLGTLPSTQSRGLFRRRPALGGSAGLMLGQASAKKV